MISSRTARRDLVDRPKPEPPSLTDAHSRRMFRQVTAFLLLALPFAATVVLIGIRWEKAVNCACLNSRSLSASSDGGTPQPTGHPDPVSIQ